MRLYRVSPAAQGVAPQASLLNVGLDPFLGLDVGVADQILDDRPLAAERGEVRVVIAIRLFAALPVRTARLGPVGRLEVLLG